MGKLSPIQKVLEAYTAVVGRHVNLTRDQAEVASSSGAKAYTINWGDSEYHSNDSATYWQGYAGYPVVTVLMLQGRLPLNQKLTDNFKSVSWNEINSKLKHNYVEATAEVIRKKELDEDEVIARLRAVYEDLKKLPITIKRGSLGPPKAGG